MTHFRVKVSLLCVVLFSRRQCELEKSVQLHSGVDLYIYASYLRSLQLAAPSCHCSRSSCISSLSTDTITAKNISRLSEAETSLFYLIDAFFAVVVVVVVENSM